MAQLRNSERRGRFDDRDMGELQKECGVA